MQLLTGFYKEWMTILKHIKNFTSSGRNPFDGPHFGLPSDLNTTTSYTNNNYQG